MNTTFEDRGYKFGKALEAINADPIYYAYEIMRGEGLGDEAEQAIFVGCERAVREIPREKLIGNMVSRVNHMLVMTEEQGASPWVDDIAESFDNGLNSVIKAYLPINYRPVEVAWSLQGQADSAFERGRKVGQQIMAAWEAAK